MSISATFGLGSDVELLSYTGQGKGGFGLGGQHTYAAESEAAVEAEAGFGLGSDVAMLSYIGQGKASFGIGGQHVYVPEPSLYTAEAGFGIGARSVIRIATMEAEAGVGLGADVELLSYTGLGKVGFGLSAEVSTLQSTLYDTELSISNQLDRSYDTELLVSSVIDQTYDTELNVSSPGEYVMIRDHLGTNLDSFTATQTLNRPVSYQEGDLLIAFIGGRIGSSFPGDSAEDLTAPAGWHVQDPIFTGEGTGHGFSFVCSKVATDSEPETYDFVLNASARCTGGIVVVEGPFTSASNFYYAMRNAVSTTTSGDEHITIDGVSNVPEGSALVFFGLAAHYSETPTIDTPTGFTHMWEETNETGTELVRATTKGAFQEGFSGDTGEIEAQTNMNQWAHWNGWLFVLDPGSEHPVDVTYDTALEVSFELDVTYDTALEVSFEGVIDQTYDTALEVTGAEEPQTGLEIRHDDPNPDWTTIQEEIDFLAQVDAIYDCMEYEVGQMSVESNPVHVVRIGWPTPPSLETIKAQQSPVVFVLASQHGSEAGCREGALPFIRELAKAATEDASIQAYLETVTWVIVPNGNPDRIGISRRNANEIDLNREYLRFHEPEAQVVGRIWSAVRPQLILDMHTNWNEGTDMMISTTAVSGVGDEILQLGLVCQNEYVIDGLAADYGYVTDEWQDSMWNIKMARYSGALRHAIAFTSEGYASAPRHDQRLREERLLWKMLEFDRDHRAGVQAACDKARNDAVTFGGRAGLRLYQYPQGIAEIAPPPIGYQLTAAQVSAHAAHLEEYLGIEVDENNVVTLGQVSHRLISPAMDEYAENLAYYADENNPEEEHTFIEVLDQPGERINTPGLRNWKTEIYPTEDRSYTWELERPDAVYEGDIMIAYLGGRVTGNQAVGDLTGQGWNIIGKIETGTLSGHNWSAVAWRSVSDLEPRKYMFQITGYMPRLSGGIVVFRELGTAPEQVFASYNNAQGYRNDAIVDGLATVHDPSVMLALFSATGLVEEMEGEIPANYTLGWQAQQVRPEEPTERSHTLMFFLEEPSQEGVVVGQPAANWYQWTGWLFSIPLEQIEAEPEEPEIPVIDREPMVHYRVSQSPNDSTQWFGMTAQQLEDAGVGVFDIMYEIDTGRWKVWNGAGDYDDLHYVTQTGGAVDHLLNIYGQVNIINMALGRLGQKPIADVTDNSPGARWGQLYYRITVSEVMAAFDWSSAIERKSLTLVPEESPAYIPYSGYALQYYVPQNPRPIRVMHLFTYAFGAYQRSDHEFRIEGDYLFTNLPDAGLVYVGDYSAQTGRLDPFVIELIVLRLAARMAFAITSSQRMASQLMQEYQLKYAEAQFADASRAREGTHQDQMPGPVPSWTGDNL